MKPSNKLLIAALLASLLSLVSLPGFATKAPDFKLPGSGKEISLSKYRNKVVYVDFWASWCTPCKQSFPWMNQIQSRYRDQGLEVIAINLDEVRSAADDFLNKFTTEFTVAFDPKGVTAQNYNVTVMPTSYLLNRKGEISYVHRGFKSADREVMESKIKELLTGKK